MAQNIVFTSYVPTSLVGVNSPSPTLQAEVITGLPIATGAFAGNCFYLTELQANQLSQTTVNSAPQLDCHAGWYMVAYIDKNATASLLQQGSIVAQLAIPITQAQENSNTPYTAWLTDAGTATTNHFIGINPAVLLNAVTPGNYTIVQIAGDATLLLGSNQAVTTAGIVLASTATGTVAIAGAITDAIYATIVGISEQALTTPAALTLTAAAATSGGTTVYTGTITGGATNSFAGFYFVIAGFTNAANNGTFLATASSATTLTLVNANGIAETHAGTATSQALIRANVAFPFGVI